MRLETLRNIKKVFLEAKTAPGANDQLSDADGHLKILQKLAKQGKESAATFTQSGREDLDCSRNRTGESDRSILA